eukprot:TRINITY_DN10046_c0_g1_i1.p1 TRINITY_DN10046_c0_g1~~TRINITY_DN10046_c0_g1_i1.p1  ORF type:complete len:339 (+),score=130.68 TRINITY_DN10046_c0_g1_i1:120-1136(+)
MKVLLAVLLCLLVSLPLGDAAGKTKRTDVEIIFNDIVSPNVVASSTLSQRGFVPMQAADKGPFVPEPPAATPTTTPFNAALSAATAVLINTGVFDRIFNQQQFTSLYRPDASLCFNYPAAPTGTLSKVLSSGVLRVGWYEAAPHAVSPGPVGLDVSFVKEVGAEIGRHYNKQINVTFVPISVTGSTLFVDVTAGLGVSYDVAIELTDLPSRRSSVNFACPYNAADLLLVRGPKDPQIQLTTLSDLNKPSVIIAAQPAGTTTGDLVRKLAPLASFIDGLTSTAAVIDALSNSRAHVAFDVGIQLRYFMTQTLTGYSIIEVPRNLLPAPAQFALASALNA